MKTYILVYELSNGHNYTPLYETIKTRWPNYAHCTEWSWVFNAEESAEEIREILYPQFVHGSEAIDKFMILRLFDEELDCDGILGISVWEKIKKFLGMA